MSVMVTVVLLLTTFSILFSSWGLGHGVEVRMQQYIFRTWKPFDISYGKGGVRVTIWWEGFRSVSIKGGAITITSVSHCHISLAIRISPWNWNLCKVNCITRRLKVCGPLLQSNILSLQGTQPNHTDLYTPSWLGSRGNTRFTRWFPVWFSRITSPKH